MLQAMTRISQHCAQGACAAAAIGLSPASGAEITMPDWPDELSKLTVGATMNRPAALPDESAMKPPAADFAAKPGAAQLASSDGMTGAHITDPPAAMEKPAPKPPAMPAAARPAADSVTEERIEILSKSGLIARQSAIAESIIIMERQLRQAELIGKLMALFGPDAPIEIAPGEYRSFGDTPAGRKIAAEIEERELSAKVRLLELRAVENSLLDTSERQEGPIIAVDELPPEIAVSQIQHTRPALLEILGINGEFRASFLVDGEIMGARTGDTLPDGTKIESITGDTVLLRHGDETEAVSLGW